MPERERAAHVRDPWPRPRAEDVPRARPRCGQDALAGGAGPTSAGCAAAGACMGGGGIAGGLGAGGAGAGGSEGRMLACPGTSWVRLNMRGSTGTRGEEVAAGGAGTAPRCWTVRPPDPSRAFRGDARVADAAWQVGQIDGFIFGRTEVGSATEAREGSACWRAGVSPRHVKDAPSPRASMLIVAWLCGGDKRAERLGAECTQPPGDWGTEGREEAACAGASPPAFIIARMAVATAMHRSPSREQTAAPALAKPRTA